MYLQTKLAQLVVKRVQLVLDSLKHVRLRATHHGSIVWGHVVVDAPVRRILHAFWIRARNARVRDFLLSDRSAYSTTGRAIGTSDAELVYAIFSVLEFVASKRDVKRERRSAAQCDVEPEQLPIQVRGPTISASRGTSARQRIG